MREKMLKHCWLFVGPIIDFHRPPEAPSYLYPGNSGLEGSKSRGLTFDP
jgi:hypothetical protein